MEAEEVMTTLTSQQATPLADLAKVSCDAICAGSTKHLRGQTGAYALWWLGDQEAIQNAWLNRISQSQDISASFINHNLDRRAMEQVTPLFTGTTANLSQRLSQHMKLGVNGRLADKLTNKKARQPGCSHHHLRLGLEELFPHIRDGKQLVLDHAGMTYCLMAEKRDDVIIDTLQRKMSPIIDA